MTAAVMQIMPRELIRDLRERLDRAERHLDDRAAIEADGVAEAELQRVREQRDEQAEHARGRAEAAEAALRTRESQHAEVWNMLRSRAEKAERERDGALNDAARLRKFADTLTDQIREFPSFTDVALLLSPEEARAKCKERDTEEGLVSVLQPPALDGLYEAQLFVAGGVRFAAVGRTEDEALQNLELATRALGDANDA